MIKGFKDFLLRGNVIDLAVAVVVGAAFTALVTAVTANLIEPVLNALGGVDTGSIGFYVNPSKPESYVNISAILNAIITFIITALVVYFVFVAPMKKISDMAAKKKVPVKADPTEVELLIQIRNLLRDQNASADTDTGGAPAGQAAGPAPAPGSGG
ncbi:large conductance mechanosensitive channel protein MscL [Nakamurella sp.]|uniref:large conductance mechanosensitive channel protein MscL n=1 Tax=Nakamurella sp. TaxID=1869182 RepID=UPI003B3AF747